MRERDLFIEALQKADPAERLAYLDAACAGDDTLRGRVLQLLTEHAKQESFLLDALPLAAAAPTIDRSMSEQPGTMIGPYKLLQKIGEGGMGVVWMAEQTEPVKRKVALKVIKPGMDSQQVIARFEAERQALAMMDHVNIARVFDGGTTGEPSRVSDRVEPAEATRPLTRLGSPGRPYFVMELVHGVPITKYCDDNHLTPRERLELFVPVCQAIQHAHQKGIIHRDIKPSNVMVTLYDGKPVPKVIDFGVAKATEQKLTERTLFTQYGTMVGTLEYMSPEQAEMSALGVDTRSDIYSLGVLLYELLTGSTPLDRKRMREAAFGEILRLIKEEEPPRPSTRISDSGEALASISANRHTEPAKLTKLVRGELDWIVMKCLEKDRNRRYETANGFAADVQRYLADEPVQACPPSAGYRFRKFVRRHKVAIGTLTCVATALILGVLVSTWQAVRATKAETLAEERLVGEKKARQDAVANLQKALEAVDQMLTRVGDEILVDVPQMQPVRKLLLEDALRFHEQFLHANINDPAIAVETAQAYRRVGAIYRDLGRYTEGEKAHLRSLALLNELKVDGALNTRIREAQAKSYRDLGFLLSAAGAFAGTRAKDAENAYRQASGIWRELATENPDQSEYQHELAECLHRLGHALQQRKQSKEAMALYHEAIAIQKGIVAKAGDNLSYRHRLAISHFFLGFLLKETDRLDESESAFREAVQIQEKVVGKAPDRAIFRHFLAEVSLTFAHVLVLQGQKEDALALRRRAVELWKRLTMEFPGVPDIFQALAQAYSALGNSLQETGRPQEAEVVFREAIALRDNIPSAFPDVRRRKITENLTPSYRALAHLLAIAGHESQALETLRQSIDLWKEWPDESGPQLAMNRHHLAVLLDKKGDRAAALDAYQRAIDNFEKLPLEFKEKPAFRKSLEYQRKRFRALLLGCHGAAQTIKKTQKPQETEAAFCDGIALLTRYGKALPDLPAGTLTSELAKCYRGLGETLAEQQRYKEAMDALRQSVKLFEKLTADFPEHTDYRRGLEHTRQSLAGLSKKEKPAPKSPMK